VKPRARSGAGAVVDGRWELKRSLRPDRDGLKIWVDGLIDFVVVSVCRVRSRLDLL
jgi:hypothetical protein